MQLLRAGMQPMQLNRYMCPAPLLKAAEPGRTGCFAARLTAGLPLASNCNGDNLGTNDLSGMSSARREATDRERYGDVSMARPRLFSWGCTAGREPCMSMQFSF